MVKVFFKRLGMTEEPTGLVVDQAQRLPLSAIAEIFGLLPSTFRVVGVDTGLSLREIKRQQPGWGVEQEPFQVWGCLALQPGLRADFSGLRADLSPFHCRLEVLELLHASSSTAVYSVKQVDAQERLVVKQLFRVPSFSEELYTYRDLENMLAGKACPSLPQMVADGFFLASGNPHSRFGDIESRLIRPAGSCVRGKIFTGPQVCKAAFDLFLALYHLFLTARRHRNVKAENVILVQQQEEDQFVLIDFHHAFHERTRWTPDEVPDAVSLVLTLAEMAGWDGEGGRNAAAVVLGRRVNAGLESFAYYTFTLPSSTACPEYSCWLQRLASAAGLPPPVL